MRHTLATLLALAVALPSPELWAEEASGLEVGERVRIVRVGEKNKLEGTVLSRDVDALTLKVKGQPEPISVPVESVRGLEVQRGRKGNVGIGMGIGILAGGVLGFVADKSLSGAPDLVAADSAKLPTTYRIGGTMFNMPSSSGDDHLGLLMGVCAGALLGAVVGLAIRTDRWEELDPDTLRVAVVPTRGGGVGAQVSFGF